MYQEALPKIKELLESFIVQEGNEDLFLVDVKINVGDRVEIFIDSDEGLSLGRCQKISRFIESHLDENKWLKEDYVLEVSSPGIDNPLKLKRQFIKNIGRDLSVMHENAPDKVTGELVEVTENGIVLVYQEKRLMAGSNKKKELVDVRCEIPFDTIKNALVNISF
jgi:ribosome maturation factor RimP